jgi:UDP-N-acetylmuramoyl-L-alanyl-D-glutamate--2,6-diaminopimelate ligase
MDLRLLLTGINGPVPAVDVTDIATHSAQVVSGGLFLACRGGRQHGLRFLPDALARGASAVAWEPSPQVSAPVLPGGVAGVAVPDLRRRLGDIANRFFACPSAALSVIGVTGTNGKTTTAWLVTQALERLGGRAAYMGTLGYGMGTGVTVDKLTTPECVTVHRRLREFAAAGADHVVAEVSSHALDQGRVDGVRFRVVAFTNLSRDHLDYHGDLDSYRRAKARLVLDSAAGHAVINAGDPFGRELAGRLPAGVRPLTVAAAGNDGPAAAAMLTARRLSGGVDGQRVRLTGQWGQVEFASPLLGAFNTENLAVAAGILLAGGFALDDVAAALAPCRAPAGRMERVGEGCPQVVVDFAHTPAALRRVLEALRQHATGRICCVFGCGGERDRGKRAEMGAVARQLADRVIVTDDNPRHEDPDAIVADILAGMGAGAGVEVVRDRAEAIARAIRAAAPDDTVLIAGKGHEAVQIIGDTARPFSDQSVARSVLEQMA